MTLSKIKVLWRQPDTLTLWGLPYDLREGQSPKDLWESKFSVACLEEWGPRAPGPHPGWAYLGSPGWFGGMDAARIEEVKQFLAALAETDDIPQGPCEFQRLTRD